ncbi:MAG TPA: 2OG-Fe(II) oxygenase, partial [Sphingomicrobium sp.]
MTQQTLDDALRLLDAGRTYEGVELLRQVASSGQPEALFVLADMTWSGTSLPQDPARGRLLFEYAASLGHTQANLLVTNLLGNGVAGKRDWTTALHRLGVEAQKLPGRQRALDLVRSMDLDANGDPRTTPAAEHVSDEPYARFYRGVLSKTECAYLIDMAEDGFRPSMVYDGQRRLVRDTIRTSDGAAFHWLIEDPAIHALNRRIAAVTGTPYEAGEPLQALRYYPGQEYRPHFDFVDGAEIQRLWTALIYLNEDYEGGETAFVRTGVEAKGRTGDVLVFRNTREDGSPEPLAEHAGKPVTAG